MSFDDLGQTHTSLEKAETFTSGLTGSHPSVAKQLGADRVDPVSMGVSMCVLARGEQVGLSHRSGTIDVTRCLCDPGQDLLLWKQTINLLKQLSLISAPTASTAALMPLCFHSPAASVRDYHSLHLRYVWKMKSTEFSDTRLTGTRLN